MPATLLGQYPRVAKYKVGGTYPGCVVALPEPGVGIILYIPIPPTGANANLTLFEKVTVTNTELDPFVGGVDIRAGADPKLIA